VKKMAKGFGKEKRAESAKWGVEHMGPSDFSTSGVGSKKNEKRTAMADPFDHLSTPEKPEDRAKDPLECCD
jgi:hypothetical protein